MEPISNRDFHVNAIADRLRILENENNELRSALKEIKRKLQQRELHLQNSHQELYEITHKLEKQTEKLNRVVSKAKLSNTQRHETNFENVTLKAKNFELERKVKELQELLNQSHLIEEDKEQVSHKKNYFHKNQESNENFDNTMKRKPPNITTSLSTSSNDRLVQSPKILTTSITQIGLTQSNISPWYLRPVPIKLTDIPFEYRQASISVDVPSVLGPISKSSNDMCSLSDAPTLTSKANKTFMRKTVKRRLPRKADSRKSDNIDGDINSVLGCL